MLKEIVDFTRYIQKNSPDTFTRNIYPKVGLHLEVHLDNSGSLKKEPQYEVFPKAKIPPPLSSFLEKCLAREIHTKWVSANKALDSKKKIHTCSPFSVAFKLKTIEEVNGRWKDYFQTAINYCQSEEQKELSRLFQGFCQTNLIKLVEETILKLEKQEEGKKKKTTLGKDDYIYCYLGNASLSFYEETHTNYLRTKVFNSEKFNITLEEQTFGVSDYLTGYNEKKPFLKHHTAPFSIGTRVTTDNAVDLYRFSQLQQNRQLPIPTPIFVDQQEHNVEMIRLFNETGERKNYRSIIKDLHEEKSEKLSSFYLLFFYMGGVKDFDFVPVFQYDISLPHFQDICELSTSKHVWKLQSYSIENIFAFETEVVQRIFNNQLIQKNKEGQLRFRYFDDLESNKMRSAIFHMVSRYRKNFYDYIYKSQKQAVSRSMFSEIMETLIIDDIKQDEVKNDKHTKEYTIKEKINIWFSLNEFFVNDTGKEEMKMAQEIELVREKINDMVENSEIGIKSDNEFAYAAGQIIYYLLSCSEASNKKHSLLEPFLQKSDLKQFKLTISRVFNQYKHGIGFHHLRFNNLAANVFSYETKTNIKELTPMLLAGYFSKNRIFKDKND